MPIAVTRPFWRAARKGCGRKSLLHSQDETRSISNASNGTSRMPGVNTGASSPGTGHGECAGFERSPRLPRPEYQRCALARRNRQGNRMPACGKHLQQRQGVESHRGWRHSPRQQRRVGERQTRCLFARAPVRRLRVRSALRAPRRRAMSWRRACLAASIGFCFVISSDGMAAREKVMQGRESRWSLKPSWSLRLSRWAPNERNHGSSQCQLPKGSYRPRGIHLLTRSAALPVAM